MGIAADVTKAFLDSKDMRYRESEDGRALTIPIGGLENKGTINILVVFDEGDKSVALRSYDVCKVPEDKLAAMYKVCSEMNSRFRWVKFYVNKDNSVAAEDDAVIQPDSCGEEVFELIIRMTGIVDEAYPEFMKTIWS